MYNFFVFAQSDWVGLAGPCSPKEAEAERAVPERVVPFPSVPFVFESYQ